MKIKFLRFFYRLAIYYVCLWSRVYRWVFHHKYLDTVVPSGRLSLDEVLINIRLLKWRPDGARELWDAIGSPAWVQYVIRSIKFGGNQPKGALDCDDFAAWICAVLRQEYMPTLLTVSWHKHNTSLSGHMVCLCRDPITKAYFHVSQAGKSKAFHSVAGAVDSVLKQYNADGLIGWALISSGLWPIRMGTVLPEN